MLAAIVTRYGPPSVLQFREMPPPVPRRDEVVVRQAASAVTAGDARIRAARVPRGFGLVIRLIFGWNGPRNPVLGMAVAGTVARVGPGVTAFREGDRVMGSTAMAMGAHAEEVAIKAARLVPLPEGLSFAEAAALPFAGHTALHFLRDGARLQAGQRVLVIGASGAVGLAMVQLARHLGAEVTAVTSGANAALVQGMGAGRIIDYRAQDYRAMAGPQDVVVDCVGDTTPGQAREMLVTGGAFCRVVAGLDAVVLAGWHGRRHSIRVLAGSGAEPPADLAWLANLAATGPLRPHVGASFPFARIAEAHALCDSGRKRGNAVVLVGADQTPA